MACAANTYRAARRDLIKRSGADWRDMPTRQFGTAKTTILRTIPQTLLEEDNLRRDAAKAEGEK